MTTERPDELITLMEGEFQQIIGRVIIQDQKTSGTNGGTFTSGAWRTRDLNTTVLNTLSSGYSLSSNQFTLLSGNYLIRGSSPAYAVGRHQTRLRNITDGITLFSGSSEWASADGSNPQTRTHFVGIITLSSLTVFEIQHRCTTTKAPDGFGVASGIGFTVDEEVYTMVKLWKIG